MTQLSVNINKIATLRNSRGGNVPDLLKVAADLQSYGAQGITIHPRPDQRHIRYDDALALPAVLTTEFNIEGNPIPKFIDLVLQIQPDQVTLVPDSEDVITSNAGWDTIKYKDFLNRIGKGNLPVTEGVREVTKDYLDQWRKLKTDLQFIKSKEVAEFNQLIANTKLPQIYTP